MQTESENLVSIVMPVYNREKQLANAIRSVVAQTYENWELIIVDDCSLDKSLTVASSFQDARVKVFSMEKNSGAAVARNLGIKNASGSFISFLDSDDTYESDFLKYSVAKLSGSPAEVGFIWTGCFFHRGATGHEVVTKTLWKPVIKESAYLCFLHELRIGIGQGITIRRSVFDTVGLFDETLPAAEDTDYFLRMTQQYSFDYVPECLIHINQGGADRLSKKFDKIALAYNQIVPKHLSVINNRITLRQKYFYKLMWLNYHLGERKLARMYFKKVLADRFTNMKAWYIFFLFELLGKRIASKFHILFSK